MITTAVQQASQMVEIQGAPSTVQADSGDFRETFAANVSAPVGQKSVQNQSDVAVASGGSSLVRQALVASLTVKSAGSSSSQSQLKLNETGEVEDISQQAAESASVASLKSGSELALKDAGDEALIAKDDSRSAVLTPVGDEASVKTVESLKTVALVPAGAGATGASTAAVKADDLGKVVDEGAAKSRKTGGLGSGKEESFARRQAIGSGNSAVTGADQTQLIAIAAVPSQPVTGAGGSLIDPKESKPGDLTSALQARDVTGGAFGSPSVSRAAAEAAITAAQLGAAGQDAAAKVTSFAGDGTALQAVPDKGTSALTKGTDVKIGTELKSADGKAANCSSVPAGATASQARSIPVPHAGVALQTVHGAQASLWSAAGSDQVESVKSDAGTRVQQTSAGQSLTNGEAAPVQVGTVVAPQLEVVREATPVSASARGVALKTEGTAVKDGKTKASVDGSADAAASSIVPAVLADASNGLSSPVALAGSAAGRAVTAGETAAQPAQVAPHIAGPATHPVSGSLESTVAARVQGAASAGAVAESASAGAQVGESHRTLLSTPTTLEVGVQSGTQGWLRIRAEVGDQGAVNASLAAGTSGGSSLLHSQLPALNAFLHSEQMAVTTTVVERGSLPGGGLGSGGLGSPDQSGSNGSLLQGGGAQGDGGRQESSQQAARLSASDSARGYDARNRVSGVEGASSGRTSASEESGRWLNVRV